MRTERRVIVRYHGRPDQILEGPPELVAVRARLHREAGADVTVEERTVSDWQPVEDGDD